MKRIAVFDFDGVILDSFQVASEVFKTMHKKYQLPHFANENLLELFDGNIFKKYEELGMSDERIREFKIDFKELFENEYQKLALFEGVKECITALSDTLELMILSSNHSDSIRRMLDTEGISGYFTQVLGSEIPGTKRDKLVAFIAETGIDPGTLYFVTDTAGDIREVEGLGIHTVAVSWGYHPAERLSASNPEIIVHSVSELQDYLEKVS
jgi:phosphoglycolate phosphatase